MEYINLGKSGLKISRLSLGAMGFGDRSWRSWVHEEGDARPILRRALDAGINLIDTCDFYSLGASEELLGRLFSGFIDRRDVVIATKLGYAMGPSPNQRGYSRKHLMEAVDASLKRLGIDHIDLYQTHIWDQSTNLEEMVYAMADLVRAGKVLYVGATDMPAWQFVKALYIAKAAGLPGFVSHQFHYNLLWREAERDLIPLSRDEHIGLLPYSPHARGFLSGSERRTGPDQTERARTDEYATAFYGRESDETTARAVQDIAARRRVGPSQIALAWVLAQPGVHSPIFGASRIEHVNDAIEALNLKLEPAELTRLDQFYEARKWSGH